MVCQVIHLDLLSQPVTVVCENECKPVLLASLELWLGGLFHHHGWRENVLHDTAEPF
jgi:hypothetical protein